MIKCIRKAFSIISTMALIVISICVPSFSASIDRLNCPYCSESNISILDDEYGVCRCDSCDNFFIIVNGQVKLIDGTTMPLIDIYDIEALIEAIENGDLDSDGGSNGSSSSSSSSSGSVEEDSDNESKDSDLDSSDVAYSLNASYKSLFEVNTATKYGDTFKKFEPESDEELLEYLAKKSKDSKDENYEDTPEEIDKATKSSIDKLKTTATNSDIDNKQNESKKRISDIPHVIRYYISIDSDIYIPEVVFNGVEFNLRGVQFIPGFTFKGWSLTKDGKKTYKDGSPMILYNFNSDSKASPNVFNFYAIWEKD